MSLPQYNHTRLTWSVDCSPAEARFQLFETLASEGIALHHHGSIADTNQAFARMFGYAEADLIGLNLKQLIAPELHPLLEARLRDQSDSPFEMIGTRKSGSQVPLEMITRQLELPGGLVEAVIVRNITAHSIIEAALRSSEERFRQIAEHIGESFWMTSPSFDQVLYVNPAFERIWGYSSTTIYDTPQILVSSIHPDDRDQVIATYMRAVLENQSIEHRIVRPDQSTRWIWSRAFPIRNKQGEVYRIVGISEDITEHRQFKLALEESAAVTRALYDIAADVHSSFDERLAHLIEMGRQRFKLPLGICARIQGDEYQILAISEATPSLKAGQILPLDETYCGAVAAAGALVSVTGINIADWRQLPCYARFQLETYFGAPILVRGELYGTLCFGSKQPHDAAFTAADEDVLRLMAQWLSGEIERRMAESELYLKHRQLQSELQRAAAVQASLLPRALPNLADFEIAAECVPALEVGGDFYDWQEIQDGISFRLCDVMGKGMQAALLMTTVRATLRAVVRNSRPAEAMGYVTRALEQDLTQSDLFVTLFMGHLDIHNHQLYYVDAGHGHVFLRRADGSVEILSLRGLPLGVLPDEQYPEGRISFYPGDALVIYSDGLIDARPELNLNQHAIAEQLHGTKSALAIIDRCIALLAPVGTPPDDVTVVVLRRCDDNPAV